MGPCLRRINNRSIGDKKYTNQVLLQNEQKQNSQFGHVRSLDQPDGPDSSSESSVFGFGTGVWQKGRGQCITSGSLSISLFCLNHFHRLTSSAVTTRAISSSFASLPCLTQAGSGHPTLPTSPSSINSFQKSSKQLRQKM